MKINETLGSAALLLILIFGVYSFTNRNDSSQNTPEQVKTEKTPRTIQVTGSAEMDVQPDEVELEITIYESSEGSLKKSEETLYKTLEKHNISKDKVNFYSAQNSWYWYYWWSYRHRTHRKQFYVTLRGDTDFLALVKSLNQRWVENIRIHKTSNSRMQELREEVKIEAVKAAKKKASYLLESIDEDLGSVVSIEEVSSPINPNDRYPYWYNYSRGNFNSNVVSNSSLNYTSNSGGHMEVDNAHSIKLRYEIVATFNIQ